MKIPPTGAVSRTTYIIVAIVLIILIASAGLAAASLRSKRAQPSTSSLTSTETSTSSYSTSSTVTSTTQTSSTTSPGSFVLAGYHGCVDASNEISGINCSWLSQQAAVWKPNSNSSLGWSVVFVGASYDYIETTSQSTLQSELNMLLASGASCIRIDIGYDAWLANNVTAQNEIQNFVSQIRSAGKCLVIADAAAERYRSSPLTWTQFQSAWVSRVSALARIFQPSFYIVIKEPGWYVPMVSDSSTNYQFHNSTVWVELAQRLSNAVLAVSPSTKVGVSIEGGIPSAQVPFFVDFLKGLSTMNNMSFIGYDQYGSNDMTLDLSIENQVQTTKSIWIAEAWTTDVAPSTGAQIMYNPDRASLDAYWIQVLYYYALYMHASVIEPFYTDAFASYTQPTNFSQRTLVFYEFQHLATTYGIPIS